MSRRIPYGRQSIDESDIKAVVDVLRSDFLTTGPRVDGFETVVAEYCGARYGVAVSSGTAALHSCMHALGVGEGDEVIIPPMTFAATANCVLYQGATPVFVDVDAETLLVEPAAVESRVTARTKAIIAVDYAGQPCDWDALRAIADRHGLKLVADACHALGATYKGRKVGTLADLTVFSFHPVKHVATGEGGMVISDDDTLVDKARVFRNHGISSDFRSREKAGAWFYEMVDLGFNYRLTDIQCALGISQMRKLGRFLERRRGVAAKYAQAFAGTAIVSLGLREECEHAYHLYVVRVPGRDRVFRVLREAGIGVNVHYVPVHLHPYYRQILGTSEGLCPIAEEAYGEVLSLPMFPGMSDGDIDFVVSKMVEAVG